MIDLLILLGLVAAIVLVTARWKISPFLALLGAALLATFLYRIPLAESVPTVTQAFGNTLGNIGLVIIFGTMIGVILERSGAAISMADALIKVLGKRFPNLTMTLIGYIVSIPVFCDSGYVILNSLRKAITARAGISALATSTALMTGLFATHNLVPPTPGPLAAAEELNVTSDLGLLIGLGLVVSLVSALAALLFASRLSHKEFAALPAEREDDLEVQDYEQLRASYGKLPHPFMAFLPISLPLVLICLGSIAKLPGEPLGAGVLAEALIFLGTPVIALILGLAAAVLLISGDGKLGQFNEDIIESIRVAAPILLITGAGAAFGAVLNASPLTDFLADNIAGMGLGLAVPFLIAAALKTAQGSSTVAIVTTAALVAPLLGSLGLDSTTGSVLAVLAIGAGAMVVSHANDSFFWVVSQLSRIPVATAYRTLTVATAVQGVTAFAVILLLSLVML
ncbi:GntP family permease [Nesterenkonia flava]|uniref:GntP family permease n=1 Tax=Nesterenkonia flava TaxID=469799 RepID=A0ABU1FQS7_9MICC|nr:GntP family permease [Nesterenkonia flava]MDR5711005.1 GntP family permease [Nesterenkonia flava]